MKSFAIVALTTFAAISSASPDHFQSVSSVLCTDAPAQTVTVTEQCAPQQTAGTGSGPAATSTEVASGGSGMGSATVTVTVTDTAAPVTITATITDIMSSSRQSTSENLTTFSTDSSASTAASTTTTSSAGAVVTHDVLVGAFKDGNNTLPDFLFKPNNISAAVGDVVRFNMLGKAHSVTQSQFAKPCIHNGTFDTQLQPNPMNVSGLIIEEFTVNVATPLWFYCKQQIDTHCGRGMVFGINPKSQLQMEQFIEMAEAQNGTTTVTSSASMSAPTGMVRMPRIKGRSARLY
ncbi:Mucin-21 [Lambiella insularis]|nr:Mucin-21 [Lambiella insularis]